MADLIQEQATTYTPGENDLVYNTVVTMGSYSSPQPVVIKQYDSLPIIAAKMRKDGNDYQVPDGAAVNIRLHKRSGTFIYSSVKGISQDRKTAYIQLTSNMTAVYGRTMPCLEIVVNGSVACTGDMVWDIQRNPVQEDDVKDTSEGQYIQEMAAQVQAFEDTYQEALDYMNNATNQSRINNAASNAQAAQQAATNAANSADEAEEEANRAAAESAKALGFRSFHGGQVVPGATDGDLDPSRPMSTPTAASVTIKARGDRIAGLTMAGKTTQAGTGDPSPDNIRPITGVGAYDQCVVFDGSEDERYFFVNGDSTRPYYVVGLPTSYPNADWYTVHPLSNWAKYYSEGTPYDAMQNFSYQPNSPATGSRRIFIKMSAKYSTISELRTYLAENPLILWYQSVNYATHTGPWYTVVELSQDPYRAVGFELNAPLFDGDSLEIGGLSGFDKMIVLDGSEDEGWEVVDSSTHKYKTINGFIKDKTDSDKSKNWRSSKYQSFDAHKWSVLPNKSFFVWANGSFGSNYVGLKDNDFSNLTDFKSYLQSHPLTVFYKSVNYTPEADISVALEKRVNGYAAFDGEEDGWEASGDGYGRLIIPDAKADRRDSEDISSQFTFVNTNALPSKESGFSYSSATAHQILLKNGTDFNSVSNVKTFLQNQYSAGTPVQVVYELATPASYARPVPTMIAQPGEDGTFTVTGENSLSVLLKAFQDGGNAARLDGHTWDDIMAAIDQKIASLTSTVMEVN